MTDPVERIAVPSLPAPAGHYSPATAWRDLVFVSGQLGRRPDGTDTVDEPFEVQAAQAITNMLTILQEAGCGSQHLLRVTAYIVGADHWPAFNGVYADLLGSAKPARTVVPVPELHHGYLIEIDAIAARA